MSKEDHRVDVDNGKYTFVIPVGGYRVAILRHGEPWHEQEEAGSALHAMMCELDAARLVLAQVRSLAQNWRAGAQARLERVIQQHDALTSDRSPRALVLNRRAPLNRSLLPLNRPSVPLNATPWRGDPGRCPQGVIA